MKLTADKLKTILLESQIVDDKELEELLVYAKDNKVNIIQALIENKKIDSKKLKQIVAVYKETPQVKLLDKQINQAVLKIIPKEVARNQKVIAFERTEDLIKLATSNLINKEMFELVAQKTGQKIKIFYAPKSEINKVILSYKINFQKMFERLLNESSDSALPSVGNDPPVRKIVDLLIRTALDEGASDIHIEPQDKELIVRFRIDGILHTILTFPKFIHSRIVARIKVMSKLRTDEHLSAQDGKIKMIFDDQRLDLRVSIIPIADGEKVVMRLLSQKSKSMSLTDLGFSNQDLEKIKTTLTKSYGMIICTGPTGSGKTTSIYSLLKEINSHEKNVTSIEDPVEYRIQGANQVQVNVRTDLTFANGLRSLLRQDPDYIFVGEIRDKETANIAVNAALTGHLVFTTLHTNDAPSTLPRLYDMKVEPFLIASTVDLIIAQRLVRRVCEKCKKETTMKIDELVKSLGLNDDSIIQKYMKEQISGDSVTLYQGEGCRVCHNTGYSGRIGIYEVLKVSKEIRALVVENENLDTIREKALEQGMTTMFEDGLKKVATGITSVEEVIRVTRTEEN